MEAIKQIQVIGIDRLLANPASPNRMPKAAFAKLKSHIERTGNYEPLVVRSRSGRPRCFEIINGAHRAEVLRQLGYTWADCVVWEVDDDEMLVLSGTLNRLRGRDDLGAKSALIKRLCERFDVRQLVARLPESRKTIERLRDVEKQPPAAAARAKEFLNPVVFFLTDEQKQILNDAMGGGAAGDKAPTSAPARAGAITAICREYAKHSIQCVTAIRS